MDDYMFSEIAEEPIFAEAVRNNFERKISEFDSDKRPFNFSRRHRKRMKALLSQKEQISQIMFVWAKRVAVCAASVMVIMSVSLMTVPEVRAAVGNAFVNWFDGFTKFGGDTEDTNGMSEYYVSVPDGFALADEVSASDLSAVVYVSEDGRRLSFIYASAADSMSVNNDGTIYNTVVDGDIVYHTFTAVDSTHASSVVWTYDGMTFAVEGYLTVDELFEVSKSFQKK
ncbi:hypothetical protein FACS1894105_04120 [Clostridia bacterium]|nr:hypothetical protein FACS1894105_04120 [Clostridia bacterium]